MIRHTLDKRIILLTALFCVVLMSLTASMAAWWGTPGYEWALSKGLTSPKSKNQLDQTVELDDLYATILKYLSMKGVYPLARTISHEDKMEGMDNVAKGIADIVNGYNSRKSLTIQQFYIVENYTLKGYETLENYKSYSQTLTREDLKNIETYLRLSRYRAATLIEDRSDREFALSRLGWVKNSGIVNYGLLPYTSPISRKEFLKVMFDLMTTAGGTTTAGTGTKGDYAIDSFYDAGVLIGYDTGLELEKLLSYTEMYAFLYRMEIFDFSTNTAKTVFYGIEDIIEDAYEANISKRELISYLQDLAENTNYQVDMITRLDEELGENWTVKEAGELLYDIYTNEGFTYTSGRSTVTTRGKNIF